MIGEASVFWSKKKATILEKRNLQRSCGLAQMWYITNSQLLFRLQQLLSCTITIQYTLVVNS